MAEWLDSILPEGYAAALLWVAGALLLLVVILLIIRLARSLTSGTFISGGRNRRARLAVMDATPVDSKRRLVLIRRDDVEHLVLIGGTTDVVIERDIRMMPRSAKPVTPQSAPLHEEPSAEAPRRAAPPEPVKPPAAPISRPALSHNVALPRPAMPMSAPPVTPDRSGRSAPAFNRSAEPPWKRSHGSTAAEPKKDPAELDEALARELQVSLDDPPAGTAAPTIDDEMNRILGELSGDRR